ncbi:MAG: dienelactone hydrolase family protein [Roseibacillus sp.]|nr:dienelactone hydrolase family protein [Roseibacillus sp.]
MKSAFWPKVATMSALVLALASPLPGQDQAGQPAEPANEGEATPGTPGGDVETGYRSEEVTFKAGEIISKAYLALPVTKTPGPYAGILVCPEWWGHNDYVRMRADMLAKLGYVALAVDLYGNGKKAHDPQTAVRLDGALKGNQKEMNARVLAHLKYLVARPEVDRTRIAAIGYGSGGDVCLQMARNGMRGLDGVVAFHPFFHVRPSRPPIRKATARVMVCDAQEDPYVHLTKGKVEAFRKEMGSVKTDLTIVPFPKAMQSFTVPDADKKGEKFRIPQAYNAKADTRAWGLLKGFLQDLWKPSGEAGEATAN